MPITQKISSTRRAVGGRSNLVGEIKGKYEDIEDGYSVDIKVEIPYGEYYGYDMYEEPSSGYYVLDVAHMSLSTEVILDRANQTGRWWDELNWHQIECPIPAEDLSASIHIGYVDVGKVVSTYWGKIAQGLIQMLSLWDSTMILTCKGRGIWKHFDFSMLNPHWQTC